MVDLRGQFQWELFINGFMILSNEAFWGEKLRRRKRMNPYIYFIQLRFYDFRRGERKRTMNQILDQKYTFLLHWGLTSLVSSTRLGLVEGDDEDTFSFLQGICGTSSDAVPIWFKECVLFLNLDCKWYVAKTGSTTCSYVYTVSNMSKFHK